MGGHADGGATVTGEEIARTFDAQNRQALLAAGEVTAENILVLMNQASIRGMQMGSQMALTGMKAALAVQKAKA